VECKPITTNSAGYCQAIALLESYELDTSDLEYSDVKLWSLEDKAQIVGIVGIERSMEIGLLRSLAVSQSHQGKGLAKELCRAVFEHAQAEGIHELFLLTETASAFFESQGFSEISRGDAPKGLRETRQFASLCPDSATVMARVL